MDKYLISIRDIDNLNDVTVYNRTKQKEEWYTGEKLIRLIHRILKHKELSTTADVRIKDNKVGIKMSTLERDIFSEINKDAIRMNTDCIERLERITEILNRASMLIIRNENSRGCINIGKLSDKFESKMLRVVIGVEDEEKYIGELNINELLETKHIQMVSIENSTGIKKVIANTPKVKGKEVGMKVVRINKLAGWTDDIDEIDISNREVYGMFIDNIYKEFNIKRVIAQNTVIGDFRSLGDLITMCNTEHIDLKGAMVSNKTRDDEIASLTHTDIPIFIEADEELRKEMIEKLESLYCIEMTVKEYNMVKERERKLGCKADLGKRVILIK